MNLKVVKSELFNIDKDESSIAPSEMLETIAKLGISLLAYKSEKTSTAKIKFSLIAQRSTEMARAINNAGFDVEGPIPCLYIFGDDVPGALASIFRKLEKANIKIIESNGIANINNGYGVVLYLEKDDIEIAYTALNK
jgi:hypothetical protein